MELVRAGFEHNIDDAPRIASTFSVGLGLRSKFVHCVKWHDDAGDAGDAALVDRRNVMPEIVIIDAVDLPIHLVGAGAVERAEPATE